MHSQHEIFVEAVRKKRKILITYFSGTQNLYLTKLLVPLKYISSGSDGGLSHYFFCDLESNTNECLITLSSSMVQFMEVSEDYFDPGDYISNKK